jgi:hypothetical protein
MPVDRKPENPETAAAAYWRSVAALSEATDRETAATREVESDARAVAAATRYQRDASRAAASRENGLSKRVRQRL